jgi:mannitol/fructose-specific phosphotransferase system IIA component (Ntr-type)
VSGPLALWPVERIAFGLPTTSKPDLLAALVDVAVKGSRGTAKRRAKFVEAVLAREKSGSTAAGGLAIPHAKVDELASPLAALAVFPDGVDFAAIDGGRVHATFLLLSPLAMATEHVETLRWIAKVARQPDFLPFLRRTKSPQQARSLLEEMGA